MSTSPANENESAVKLGRFARHGELEIDKLFRALVKFEGSDLHLKVGSSPIVRVGGSLRPLNRGPIDDEEMARVFNLGLGMVVAVSADTVDVAVTALSGAGVDPVVVGWVEEGERGVELTGPPLWPGG